MVASCVLLPFVEFVNSTKIKHQNVEPFTQKPHQISPPAKKKERPAALKLVVYDRPVPSDSACSSGRSCFKGTPVRALPSSYFTSGRHGPVGSKSDHQSGEKNPGRFAKREATTFGWLISWLWKRLKEPWAKRTKKKTRPKHLAKTENKNALPPQEAT